MSKLKLSFYSFSALIILMLSFFFIQSFRIDASSDTLVAQNDEEFKYFNFYNKIFTSENFLVLAIVKRIDKFEAVIETKKNKTGIINHEDIN